MISTRGRQPLVWRLTASFLVLGFSAAVSRCSNQPARTIEIGLVADANSTNQIVQVSGLSGHELSRLRAKASSDPTWPALLQVRVAGGAQLPIDGRYVVTHTSLEFHPRFPFDSGRGYAVRFDPQQLPTPRTDPVVERVLSVPGAAKPAPATVSAIYPSGGTWPANVLRFYVHFSAPMSRESGIGRVHLVDAAGVEVPDALLPVDVDLWNHDHTRFTVLFDPGRVKRDILPNRRMGRALVDGRKYAIVVDAEWHDGTGQPLKQSYRHEFVVGPPIERALDPAAWRLTSPSAGTRDPLVVTFPAMLDEGLVHRAMGVAPRGGKALDGSIDIRANETEWRFVPASAWTAGRYDLVALSILEDPSGNRIGRAFEIMSGERTADEVTEFRVPFEVK